MSLCLGGSFQHAAAACVMQSLHDWSVLAGPRLCPACKSRSFPLLTTCVNMDGKWVATRQIWVTRLVRGVNMIRGPLCLPCTHCVHGPGSVLGVAKRATAALTPYRPLVPIWRANVQAKNLWRGDAMHCRSMMSVRDMQALHAGCVLSGSAHAPATPSPN